MYELLASMVVSKSYQKIMDKSRLHRKKARLGRQHSQEEREELKQFVHKHQYEMMNVMQNLNK